LPQIVKVEAGCFGYDFAGEFKFFKPDADGKVRRPSVLLRLTDERGLQGWGQAVPIPRRAQFIYLPGPASGSPAR